ncbi:hypothetical protein [Singulisphaera acidiphila]|uniref:Uncharacterized protein n=1 Tax=Singulisphaera acidiphila (strain ATCC BAA-1392 / DSM 18658 / VKM B-2454 / MOB10) TaxID=886293 RepID=L0DPM7_SINAD|nr:hypothetical protein [Singulisphaera acidiphila]AGA30636.1 hypothetical protein Sinac_6561 [Singulisphaera acidiphila DSM 18658]
MSRPRSAAARGASGGARGAAGRPGVFVQSPRSDIFVALLGIALGAMVLGCLLLVLLLQRYEFTTKAAVLTQPSNTALAALSENSEHSFSVRL